MRNPNDFLYAGSSAQRAAISGIQKDHAFEKHGHEIPGTDERSFAVSAMRDLNTADSVYEFNQPNGPGLLFTNQQSGMVGWINTATPESSTYFMPRDGIENYVRDQIDCKDMVKEISVGEIETTNRNLSPDHAQTFHHGPQKGMRLEPEQEKDIPEAKPEIDDELSAERSGTSVGEPYRDAPEVADDDHAGPTR